jgi:hypothetical protein
MATSVVTPGLTGGQTDFLLPFDYLSRSHVYAQVEGVPVALSFLSTYMVQITPSPVGTLFIYRKTPSDEPMNVYSDGSVLIANDLNLSFIQSLFISQELEDVSLNKDALGQWDMDNLRVTNVAAPVNPNDAANKTWVTTQFNSGVDAGVAKAAAEAARDAAILAKTGSESARDTSILKASEATGKANDAAASAASALASKDTAVLKAAEASASAVASEASKVTAVTKATEASSSATSAATSATTATTKASQASTSEANAAASAAASLASKNASEDAKVLSEAARDAAIVAKNAAETAEDSAGTSASSASMSALTATTKASEASASATSAAGSASTATTKASEAAASAAEAASYAGVLDPSNIYTKAEVDAALAGIDMSTKADLDSPTFTGTVTLPETTAIGGVTATEIGYLDGVTSSIQTQFNGKAAAAHGHSYTDISNFAAGAVAAQVGATAGGVGSYAMLSAYSYSINFVQGTSYAGSNLRFSGMAGGTVSLDTDAPSGTWRCMGRVKSASGAISLTLFLRIA